MYYFRRKNSKMFFNLKKKSKLSEVKEKVLKIRVWYFEKKIF